MPADLFVYALVAAGLVFWLRSVLGTKHGEERQRPDPFKGADMGAEDAATILGEIRTILGAEHAIRELAQNPAKNYRISGKSAEDGLIEIATQDKGFDIHRFMDAAQDAFAIIVESFADGDRTALKDLLGAQVYAAFDGAITAREAAGHKQVTDIHAIRMAEVTDARIEGRHAFVTVRFTAEESSTTKDASGNIIAGHPDKISEMRDVWVFSRDVKSKDPSWLVVETRGGFDGDNEHIPDSH